MRYIKITITVLTTLWLGLLTGKIVGTLTEDQNLMIKILSFIVLFAFCHAIGRKVYKIHKIIWGKR